MLLIDTILVFIPHFFQLFVLVGEIFPILREKGKEVQLMLSLSWEFWSLKALIKGADAFLLPNFFAVMLKSGAHKNGPGCS